MNTYISSVPLWAIVLFVVSFAVTVAMIASTVRKTALDIAFEASRIRTISIGIFGFYLAYFSYVTVLTLSGAFAVNALPPRILLVAGLPMALFLFGMASRNATFRTLLENTPLEELVAIHRFRFVGVFFLLAMYFGELPSRFALMAGLGDILSALGAIIVVRAIKNRAEWSFSALIVWNLFGIADIVDVLGMAIFAAREAIASGGTGVLGITEFPFSWIPAFAPPTILFLHFQVFKRLKAYKMSLQEVPMMPQR